jgi:hypothetical protein
MRERLAPTGREPSRERARPRDGDLLAQHRSQGHLGPIDTAWNPPARRAFDQRADQGVTAENLPYGDGVRIEIQ